MSQRARRGIEIPVHKISDKSKLLWERYQGPMQSAAASMNAAIQNTQNILAAVIMEAEGYDVETHLFDMERLVIIPRPPQPGDNGATVG